MSRSPDLEARQYALAMRLEGRTFAEIGQALGFSRQRAQQILRPSKAVASRVLERSGNRCEECGRAGIGQRRHIHHRAARGLTPETYNAEPNLIVLCIPCHRAAHADPDKQEQRRPRTAEEMHEVWHRHGHKTGARMLGISVEEYAARRERGERWCHRHQDWEPAERFGVLKSAHDGLASTCREGNRETVRLYQTPEYRRDYYQRNRERLSAYHREWTQRRKTERFGQAAQGGAAMTTPHPAPRVLAPLGGGS